SSPPGLPSACADAGVASRAPAPRPAARKSRRWVIARLQNQKGRRFSTAGPRSNLLADADESHFVGQAVGEDEVAVLRDVRVAHDVAAARNRPALELLRLRIEAHHGVRARP